MTKSEHVFIGRNADGEKLYVTAELRHSGAGKLWRTRTDHERTTERLTLAIQGVVISKYGNLENDRSYRAGGQLIEELLNLVSLADGWTVGDVTRLHEIWTRWHLNDMRAGCDHQTEGKDSPPCPETGYKYGSAWLFKQLPYKVFAFICDRFEIEPPEPGSFA